MRLIANIAKSLLFLSVTSGTVSYILHIKYNNFWQAFTCITLLQVIGYNIYSKITNLYIRLNNKKSMILEASKLNDAGVDVTCSFCGEVNMIPISFTKSNDFVCTKCNKENAVYINITTAQKTDTSITSAITVNSFDDNIEIAKNQILNS